MNLLGQHVVGKHITNGGRCIGKGHPIVAIARGIIGREQHIPTVCRGADKRRRSGGTALPVASQAVMGNERDVASGQLIRKHIAQGRLRVRERLCIVPHGPRIVRREQQEFAVGRIAVEGVARHVQILNRTASRAAHQTQLTRGQVVDKQLARGVFTRFDKGRTVVAQLAHGIRHRKRHITAVWRHRIQRKRGLCFSQTDPPRSTVASRRTAGDQSEAAIGDSVSQQILLGAAVERIVKCYTRIAQGRGRCVGKNHILTIGREQTSAVGGINTLQLVDCWAACDQALHTRRGVVDKIIQTERAQVPKLYSRSVDDITKMCGIVVCKQDGLTIGTDAL